MSGDELGDISKWSREQDKNFENALATYPEDLLDRWEKIAADVPGKSIEEVRHHYELLVDDVNQIEAGYVPLLRYNSSSDCSINQGADERISTKGGNLRQFSSDFNRGGKVSRSEQERRKGIAWTEEEHRLFLLGLEKYGKSDWRSISRNFVVTRTPTQVASHAQKYFIRMNSMNKDRRRSSIHDITTVNNGETSVPQAPITGMSGSSSGSSSGKPSKQSQSPLVTAGVGMYGGTTIGQPVGGSLVSGIPVNLPQPAHMVYGVRAPSRQVVPGAPVNMSLMAYPMPQTSAHR